ncbi:hypothetical protein CBS147343_3583 [Aspergillus niger]|nr:hypothetical protein CBS115988_8377 [Aspergillus niger]KAI2919327.1 hypothetical protein CBS147371_3690 [Aspergillus niger]KAI3079249.1 hypothetical protein CBS147343_3583 [Aspergillus niger]
MTFYRRYGNDNYLSDESFEGERSSDISDLETPMEMIMGDFESTMNSAFPTLADLITDSSPSPHVNGASNSDENGTGSWPSVDTIPLAEFNNRSEATRTNDIEERNPHVQFLANRVRPPVKPMIDPRDATVYHPCGATVIGATVVGAPVIEDLVAIYERIGDNPLSFKEADRFPQRVSKVAGEDSPLADILREIKISFEKTAVRDGYADPETPSSSSSESDEWPIALGYDGCGDGVPIRANIGAHRSSRRVIEREYSPATAAYLVDASSDDSFNTHAFRVEDQMRD